MNWGKGITIVIIIFLFSLFMMIFTVSNQKIDLVTEDYYPKELKYQQEIDKQKNFHLLNKKPQWIILEQQIVLQFPEELISDSINGSIHFYRPSDKFLDKHFNLSLNKEYRQAFDVSDFKQGKYELVLSWESENKQYFTKQTIVL